MKMKKVLMLLGVLMLMTSALAVVQLGEDYVDAHNDLSNQLSFIFGRTYTMIGGFTCSDKPDKIGSCIVAWSPECEVYCPSKLRGGCAIDIYDSDYKFMFERKIEPGETEMLYWNDKIGQKVIYENYYCDTDCVCTDWERDKSCGLHGCDPDKIYETRDCSGDCGIIEEACIYEYSCRGPGVTTTTQPGGGGGDNNLAMYFGVGLIALAGLVLFGGRKK